VSDADQLRAAFSAGTLLQPAPDRLNLVDLARALARLAGVDEEPSPGSDEITGHIGTPDHLVFVLADGLGMAQLELLPPDSFLRRQLATELRTVFPSTTAVALTTLAIGQWPAQHAITGWWTYLREIDGPATVVKFEQRAGHRPLGQFGVTPSMLLPSPSLMPRISRDVRCFFPAAIAGSVYSQYVTGGVASSGYPSVARGVDEIVARVRGASRPTYSYLYMPRIDSAAHEYGAADPHVVAELVAFDRQIEWLAVDLGPGSRVVVTADHGHLDAPAVRRRRIHQGGAIAGQLRVPPSYDSRVMCFHLLGGSHDAWLSEMRERFGDGVYLLTVDEVEELELFGPGPLSPLTRERLGDYVSIVRADDVIGYGRSTSGERHLAALAPQRALAGGDADPADRGLTRERDAAPYRGRPIASQESAPASYFACAAFIVASASSRPATLRKMFDSLRRASDSSRFCPSQKLRFAAFSAAPGQPAMCVAHSIASSRARSSGTTRLTAPISSARCAEIGLPSRIISRQRAGPIRWASRVVPPAPGMMPSGTSGCPYVADSAATRRSQAHESSAPPPQACPLFTAIEIIGWPATASKTPGLRVRRASSAGGLGAA
jgi:hypothetical protein